MKPHQYYSVGKDGKLERKRRFCPRCGDGTFMAEHSDRYTCGSCGFTDFKQSKGKEKSE